MKLTPNEAMALAAIVRRAGMGAVLEELARFARELAAGDEQWQAVADELHQVLTTSDSQPEAPKLSHDAELVRLFWPTPKRS